VVGGAVFAGTGVRGSLGLVTYFVTSSLLSRLPSDEPIAQTRGNRRDAVQVLANGGVPALLAVASLNVNPPLRRMLLAGFGGAVATAAADTWATEIGSRLGRDPRSVVTLRPVPRGASGGVTLAGLAASAAGAALMSTVLVAGHVEATGWRRRFAVVAIGGVVGGLVDSVLGATLQEVRFCDVCDRETELLRHSCGNRTRRVRGSSWCTNDAVNALSITAGAAVTMASAATRVARGGNTRVEYLPREMLRLDEVSVALGALARRQAT
jgi:uncharacterized protein (TIGR00297 family)